MNQSPSSEQADILIVDDSPDELRLLSHFLRQQGYHVRQALDGEMAILAIQTQFPDLILLETSLPRLNGYEVCQQLKNNQKTQTIPLIFLGTFEKSSERIKVFKVGGSDYLTKPYHLEEVLVRIEYQLRSKRQRDYLSQENYQLQQQLNLQEMSSPSPEEGTEKIDLLKSAIAATHNGIIITDATQDDHPIIYVNPGFENMTGYLAAEVLGKNCRFMQGNDRDQDGLIEIRNAIQGERECCVTIRNYRKNGILFWNEISLSPIFDRDGNVIYFIGVQTDVTERKRAEEELQRVQSSLRQMNRELYRLNNQLHRLANLDGLTGVANRRCFDEHFSQEWQRMAREKLPLSLILADIDYFKLFNDTYLHLKGDDCLKAVAQAIGLCVHRPADIVARNGGEEFAILLPNTPLKGAIGIAENIRQKIYELKIAHQKSPVSEYVTLSLGVATQIPSADLRTIDLMKAADQALYSAKEQGRNCVVAAPSSDT